MTVAFYVTKRGPDFPTDGLIALCATSGPRHAQPAHQPGAECRFAVLLVASVVAAFRL